jgi:ParB family transcriptional regulator, chromosome partitioning protein
MNKRGLGRGLDALLPGNGIQSNGDDNYEIPVAEISPNRFQPRKDFDPERLAELVESVKLYGVLQPVVVRRHESGYELVAGERRWRASQIAGLKNIPAVVRNYTDTEMTAVALVENLQRENLNPIEEARAYRRLIDEFGFTQEEVSQKVGKSRPFIANVVRLLNLPPAIQEYVSRGTMSPGQARPLLVLPTAEMQVEAAAEIVTNSLTSRESEELSRKMIHRKIVKPKKKADSKDIDEQNVEDRLSEFLATKVRIQPQGAGRGVIEIEYYSDEELQRIVEKIEGISEREMVRGNRHKTMKLSV